MSSAAFDLIDEAEREQGPIGIVEWRKQPYQWRLLRAREGMRWLSDETICEIWKAEERSQKIRIEILRSAQSPQLIRTAWESLKRRESLNSEQASQLRLILESSWLSAELRGEVVAHARRFHAEREVTLGLLSVESSMEIKKRLVCSLPVEAWLTLLIDHRISLLREAERDEADRLTMMVLRAGGVNSEIFRQMLAVVEIAVIERDYKSFRAREISRLLGAARVKRAGVDWISRYCASAIRALREGWDRF